MASSNIIIAADVVEDIASADKMLRVAYYNAGFMARHAWFRFLPGEDVTDFCEALRDLADKIESDAGEKE